MKSLLILFSLVLFSCGKKNSEADTKIGNGEVIERNSTHPGAYSAVGLSKNEGLKPFCSGVLVKKDLIITAAHCINGASYVYLGGLKNGPVPQFLKITEKQVHPNYSRDLFPNFDIGWIKFEGVLPENYTSIDVARTEDVSVNQVIYQAGFGADENGMLDGTVRASKAVSNQIVTNSLFKGIMMSLDEYEHGTLGGDSGGPIYVKSDERWKVAAVTQGIFLEPTKIENKYMRFYTLIWPHIRWIAESTREYFGENYPAHLSSPINLDAPQIKPQKLKDICSISPSSIEDYKKISHFIKYSLGTLDCKEIESRVDSVKTFSLVVSDDEYSEAALIDYLPFLTNLNELEIENFSEKLDFDFKFIQSSKVDKLKFYSPKLRPLNFNQLSQFKNLKTLAMDFSELSTTDLPILENLEVLIIRPFDENGIEKFLDFKKLKKLNFMTILSNQHNLSILSNLPLEELRLGIGENFSPDFSVLPVSLREFETFTAPNLDSIKGFLHLKNLEVLDVANAKIESLEGISKLSMLKELKLYKNQIQDVSPIADLLNLNILDLSSNRVLTIEPIKNLSKIERISVRDNPNFNKICPFESRICIFE